MIGSRTGMVLHRIRVQPMRAHSMSRIRATVVCTRNSTSRAATFTAMSSGRWSAPAMFARLTMAESSSSSANSAWSRSVDRVARSSSVPATTIARSSTQCTPSTCTHRAEQLVVGPVKVESIVVRRDCDQREQRALDRCHVLRMRRERVFVRRISRLRKTVGPSGRKDPKEQEQQQQQIRTYHHAALCAAQGAVVMPPATTAHLEGRDAIHPVPGPLGMRVPPLPEDRAAIV